MQRLDEIRIGAETSIGTGHCQDLRKSVGNLLMTLTLLGCRQINHIMFRCTWFVN